MALSWLASVWLGRSLSTGELVLVGAASWSVANIINKKASTKEVFGFLVWSGICVGIKRCHDRERSGWFLLVSLIPFIGAIWLTIELYFLRGTVGPNKFGEDPLDSNPTA